MRRLGDERGFTLVEMLFVATLSTVVLSATLVLFDNFVGNWATTARQNDSQQQSRVAIATIARQLRNLASPTNQLPQAIEKAQPYDFVYQTVDTQAKPPGSANARNVKRVRYCLTPESGGKSRLLRQEQRWTTATAPSLPATGQCPDGWPDLPGSGSNSALAGADAVNLALSPQKSVFTYNSAVNQDITSVGIDLVVDVNPGKKPAAASLRSGAFLRNQNRPPTASFTATRAGNRILFNGSASDDPEGRAPRTYVWYADGGSDPVANGIIGYWTPPSSTFPQTHSFTLHVCDPVFSSILNAPTGLQECDPNGLTGSSTQTGVVIQ